MKYLIEKEEKTLLHLLSNRKDAERDYMIVHLADKAGLRLGELAGLNNGDLRNRETVRIRKETTKGAASWGRAREVPLNKDLREHVAAYFKRKGRWQEELADDAPFFVSRLGIRLSQRAIYNLVKKWVRIAGLDPKFSPHSLRHSFSKRILERYDNNTKVLPTLQRLLGHVSLSSTGIYVEPGREELAAAVEAIG